MTDAPVAAVMEFKWHGDIARPVSLAFVYGTEVARDLVLEPLVEVDGRAAWLMPISEGIKTSTTVLSPLARQGVVPSAWVTPTAEMILLFRPD